ncbi:hypothetical protein [Cupriavidus sp.]|uniref:hypothetical protein n=1 Tax=Cupriavidus sp. TaxID=1873897 RepID=UPI0025BC8445|nr:hypothetical protein [Cupriavidus sp.]MCA3202893.1 hypothetical protein [Cupriavidus sp.]MCA3206443.1 hypothetical protein [Cupriavidus sp.]
MAEDRPAQGRLAAPVAAPAVDPVGAVQAGPVARVAVARAVADDDHGATGTAF